MPLCKVLLLPGNSEHEKRATSGGEKTRLSYLRLLARSLSGGQQDLKASHMHHSSMKIFIWSTFVAHCTSPMWAIRFVYLSSSFGPHIGCQLLEKRAQSPLGGTTGGLYLVQSGIVTNGRKACCSSFYSMLSINCESTLVQRFCSLSLGTFRARFSMLIHHVNELVTKKPTGLWLVIIYHQHEPGE